MHSGIFPNGSGLFGSGRPLSAHYYRYSEPAGTKKPEWNGAKRMGVRLLLLASVSAFLLVECGLAYAQDKDKDNSSYTTELPPIEVSPPRTAVRPGRPRDAPRRARPATRPVTTVTRL